MRTLLFASFRRRLGAAVAGVGIVLSLFVGAAPAAERVALVIGNGAYEHVAHLANPSNDAEDMGSALARLGFAVTRLDNAGFEEMRKGLREFEEAAARSEVAVVFYAGHGIEVDNRNYLIPVDARLESDRAVKHESMPLDRVMESVQDASRFRLVILDACRNNPFVKSMKRRDPTRQINRGLSRVEPSGDTLVAYAAKEGTTAADRGKGRNSPYTQALLRYLEQPGLEVMDLFRFVNDAVKESTGGSQEPHVYGLLSSRRMYLSAPPEGKGSASGQGPPPNPFETARPAEQVVLPDGLTLADWALQAENLLEAGEHARVEAEAAAHIKRYGRVGAVAAVRERAVAGLVKGIRFETRDEAASALERIAGIEAGGRAPELLRLKARAHRLLGDYAAEEEAHRGWLRAAPQTHPERREVLGDLAHARVVVAQGKRFSELLGRPFSEKWKEESVGWTDMHYAALLDLPGVVAALADAGMDVDVRLRSDLVPFGDDLKRTLGSLGHAEEFKDWRGDGQTSLMIASITEVGKAAAELIARGANINASTRYEKGPLHYAARSGSLEVAKLLLAAGADVNAGRNDGHTPLYGAALENSSDVAELLLAAGADVNAVNKHGFTPLYGAAARNSSDVAKLLLAAGADVNAVDNDGITPLYGAALENSSDVAKLLLAAGADVNTVNKHGHTPLYGAAQVGSLEVAKLLLAAGADVNAVGKNSNPPLLAAAAINSSDIAKLLLAAGADVSATNNKGYTPLLVAAAGNSSDVAKLLLAAGADVNAGHKNGYTPLHLAAYVGSLDIAKLLLAAGADVNATTNDGYTPLDVALSKDNVRMEEFLRRHGGKCAKGC